MMAHVLIVVLLSTQFASRKASDIHDEKTEFYFHFIYILTFLVARYFELSKCGNFSLTKQYDGGITSQAVKARVAEIMYNWYVGLPSELKIAEAYRMLKQQGIC